MTCCSEYFRTGLVTLTHCMPGTKEPWGVKGLFVKNGLYWLKIVKAIQRTRENQNQNGTP